ncbi:hypothetical protein VHEMI03064 [[Torrubiella] hemipterigena]|uniref:DUF1989 domain-containing protein n=1 Tax=[Torrubiella] hemipterigena TaxID=1531966 RepID=A0A0A1T9S0_9HYPO|nr:hypothetical protein VHEMI03064 [[Torrubiella] hemipterigena]
MPPTTISARTGGYAALKKGQKMKLINPTGTQVIDFWAFAFPQQSIADIPTSFIVDDNKTIANRYDMTKSFPFVSGVQYFSASRTRSILSKLVPSAVTKDVLYTNKSLPMFTLIEDTTTGIHDTLFGCCDRFRYQNLGVGHYEHESCSENMHLALEEAADDGLFEPGTISTEWTPDPFNVFMNVPITTGLGRESGGGRIECVPPACNAGEYIVLRAELDCVAVMSACPNDVIVGVNTGRCERIEYEILD